MIFPSLPLRDFFCSILMPFVLQQTLLLSHATPQLASLFSLFHLALAHFSFAASSAFFRSSPLGPSPHFLGPIEFHCALKLFWYSSLKHATASMPVVGHPAPWLLVLPLFLLFSVFLFFCFFFFVAAAGPASECASVRAMFSSSAMFSAFQRILLLAKRNQLNISSRTLWASAPLGFQCRPPALSRALGKGFLCFCSLCYSAVAWHMFNAQLFWSCCAFSIAFVRVWVAGWLSLYSDKVNLKLLK